MGKSTLNFTVTTTYALLALCVLVCHSAAAEVTEEDADIINGRDHNMLTGLELFLGRKLFDIFKENPRFQNYAFLNDPEQSEMQNNRLKRPAMAGLENLDFMTTIFSKLPMSSNAALSDMRKLMREAGRKRK